MTSTNVLPSIEERLAAAGLPPLPRTAWLEIDLDAIAGNLAALRGLTGPGVPVYPVVKADAYGHGAVPVALALEAAGADGFCVAAMDEALALRAGGVRRPIRVLYPVPPAFAVPAARGGIRLAAGDRGLLEGLLEAASADPTAPPLELEIEVETGLGRGGFAPEAVLESAQLIRSTTGVRLSGLWTHLLASEDAAQTASQLERLDAAAASLAAAGIPLPERHAAASGGVLTDVVALDGVRPGLAVYGVFPEELEPVGLPEARWAAFAPAMSLHARPVRVIDLPTGSGVSYGAEFVTARPSRIATLPLGYGDGYARALTGHAQAIVRGRRVPVVGLITMDAVMADVTDVPGTPVTTVDEFVLLGRQGEEEISAATLARQRTTNTREVVTSMAGRLPRVYHAAARAVGMRTLTERRG